MNAIRGGFIKSYMSWEFVRLTVNSHITAPGTIRAYARLENPMMRKNGASNSNFSSAIMADAQKTGLTTVKVTPAKPITAASAMDKIVG